MNHIKIRTLIFTFMIMYLNAHAFQNLQIQNSANSRPFIPGDGVLVNTFPDTSSFLNKVFPIDDRGYVEFPIEGKVKITNMTVKEFENYLKDTFKIWLRSPNIYVKPVIRLSLLGGFRSPGLYYVDSNNSLWDVVRKVGGPVLEDGIYNMSWERDGDEVEGDLTKYFEYGISLNKIGIKSGDQIWTESPETETVWDKVNNIMPIITISTTIFLAYITYQQTAIQSTR